MRVSLIVAAAEDRAIGKDNALLWHLPNDLKYFKNKTWGMPVIMGRRTFESVAGEPLPGRFNIIVTRQSDYLRDRDDIWLASTLESALDMARQTHCLEAFVAGGSDIYALAMPLASRVYLTRVHARFPEADRFFPELDTARWKLVSSKEMPADEKHAYACSFEEWETY